MGIAEKVSGIYQEQTEAFAGSRDFRHLETGPAMREDYANLLCRLFITHYQSPKVMAFLYAVAPPAGAEAIRHNLLEEMGLEAGEASHPDLLKAVLLAAGFDARHMEELEGKSLARIRGMACDPLLYGTLMETGLAVLLEAGAFEWMLSRLAGRMGDMLARGLGLRREDLAWFYHHGEVDVRHAEETLGVIEAYCAYYGVAESDLENILEITFRENIFHRQYLPCASAS